MKLLANENIPQASIKYLREPGYDIASISLDHMSVSDEEVMQIADREQRLIVTFDRDYGELVFKHKYKPAKGITYLRLVDLTPTEPGRVLRKLLTDFNLQTDQTLTVFDGTLLRQRKY